MFAFTPWRRRRQADSLGLPEGSPGPEGISPYVLGAPAMLVAEGASALLELLHPDALRPTGQAAAGGQRRADPARLLWTYTVRQWCTLRAAAQYGPRLTPAQQDQFLVEQAATIKLQGVDPALLPASAAVLESAMQDLRDTLTEPLELSPLHHGILPPGFSLRPVILMRKLIGHACLDVLTPEMRAFYGRRHWPPWQHWLVTRATRLLLGGTILQMRRDQKRAAGTPNQQVAQAPRPGRRGRGPGDRPN